VAQLFLHEQPEAAALEEKARLRVYIGAAPGVGKTYTMLEHAHQLRKA
jgi:two-component system sensor histidine kinase KdpD